MFGGTRCSPTGNIHKDSDRFVWRRATSCLIFNGSFVVGEKPNCAEKDLIDIFSYTYDNGSIPYENQGVLSKHFTTKIKVETWYIYKLATSPFETVYELFDENHQLLETSSVNHKGCGVNDNSYQGGVQALYFGYCL